jgi:hypothetical protein
VGRAGGGTRVAISARPRDAAARLTPIQSAAGGKGGGSPGAANGNLGRAVTVEEILTILKS